ncbi:unnamed protein product [Linum trigynum]|uniref:MATH domain-containing protein n=1 Tax=Linum trigynum TaxID=586398 RepID=A0AAV2DAJ0_9ROSI
MEPKTCSAATAKDTQKFTWKISNFSTVKETKLYSDTFSAGGHKWRVLAYPKGNAVNHFFSLFVEVAETEAMAAGWSVPAGISLTLVDQVHGRSSVKSFKHTFKEVEKVLGFKSFIRNGDLVDLRKGFLVNDTLLIEAQVYTEATPTEQAVPRPAEESNQPHGAAAGEPKTPTVHIDSGSETEIQADGPQASLFSSKVARTSTTTSPRSSASPSVQSLKSLISELSTMSSRWRSSSTPDCLEKQSEELVDLFEMSLEKISRADLFDEVEKIIVKVADNVTDTIKVMVLKDLVSRLAEFKETIPKALSTIESAASVETRIVAASKNLEARLGHREDQLSSLKTEASRLEEVEMKLEADIQQMVALRDKTRHQKDSTIAELEKASQEVLVELDELRRNDEERQRIGESRLKAKETLAQSNTSWKLFKENLGL